LENHGQIPLKTVKEYLCTIATKVSIIIRRDELNVSYSDQSPILFYDGNCGICNLWIKFIIHLDEKNHLFFSSFSSDLANNIFVNKHELISNPSTVVLVTDKHVYTQSTAILNALILNMKWKKMSFLLLYVPRIIRDILYFIISKLRNNILRNQYCYIPPEHVKNRFID